MAFTRKQPDHATRRFAKVRRQFPARSTAARMASGWSRPHCDVGRGRASSKATTPRGLRSPSTWAPARRWPVLQGWPTRYASTAAACRHDTTRRQYLRREPPRWCVASRPGHRDALMRRDRDDQLAVIDNNGDPMMDAASPFEADTAILGKCAGTTVYKEIGSRGGAKPRPRVRDRDRRGRRRDRRCGTPPRCSRCGSAQPSGGLLQRPPQDVLMQSTSPSSTEEPASPIQRRSPSAAWTSDRSRPGRCRSRAPGRYPAWSSSSRRVSCR